jgi:hypothetical protein
MITAALVERQFLSLLVAMAKKALAALSVFADDTGHTGIA